MFIKFLVNSARDISFNIAHIIFDLLNNLLKFQGAYRSSIKFVQCSGI